MNGYINFINIRITIIYCLCDMICSYPYFSSRKHDNPDSHIDNQKFWVSLGQGLWICILTNSQVTLMQFENAYKLLDLDSLSLLSWPQLIEKQYYEPRVKERKSLR